MTQSQYFKGYTASMYMMFILDNYNGWTKDALRNMSFNQLRGIAYNVYTEVAK